MNDAGTTLHLGYGIIVLYWKSVKLSYFHEVMNLLSAETNYKICIQITVPYYLFSKCCVKYTNNYTSIVTETNVLKVWFSFLFYLYTFFPYSREDFQQTRYIILINY
jgi:hypothetical protein